VAGSDRGRRGKQIPCYVGVKDRLIACLDEAAVEEAKVGACTQVGQHHCIAVDGRQTSVLCAPWPHTELALCSRAYRMEAADELGECHERRESVLVVR
jgi:hypothetical protein